MVQNLKKVLKSKISEFFPFLRHEVPFKAKNNREAVVVCAIHVVMRPSKRSVLVYYYNQKMYVRGPQHSITGGDHPPQYIQVGEGKYPPTLPGSTPIGTGIERRRRNMFLVVLQLATKSRTWTGLI